MICAQYIYIVAIAMASCVVVIVNFVGIARVEYIFVSAVYHSVGVSVACFEVCVFKQDLSY